MTVRWGFIGAGWIAQRAMGPAVRASSDARLSAVASRDPSRSASLEPDRVHDSYRTLLEDPSIDVVYVALANDQHADWVVAALTAGKHVLCEKPLGCNASEAERMVGAARDADRLLVEAVWSRWHPRFRRLVDLVRSGGIGELERIDSSFTFTGDIDGNYRADPGKGGGALLDVGGYQVHSWVAVAGPRITVDVDAIEVDRGPTGIDLTTRADVTIDGRARASLLSSFRMPEMQTLIVSGSAGVARFPEGSAFTSWREPSALLIDDRVEHFDAVDAYVLMVDAVSARASGADAFVVPLADSVAVATILDRLGAAS